MRLGYPVHVLILPCSFDESDAHIQEEAVYGLTEAFRDKVRVGRLIANPGCYPTSVQLPLIPLLKVCLIDLV